MRYSAVMLAVVVVFKAAMAAVVARIVVGTAAATATRWGGRACSILRAHPAAPLHTVTQRGRLALSALLRFKTVFVKRREAEVEERDA